MRTRVGSVLVFYWTRYADERIVVRVSRGKHTGRYVNPTSWSMKRLKQALKPMCHEIVSMNDTYISVYYHNEAQRDS